MGCDEQCTVVNFREFWVDFVNNIFFYFFEIFRDFGEEIGGIRVLEKEKGIG